MRSAVVLTQLALLVSTAHAFFPFTPKWLREKLEREQRRNLDGSTGSDGLSFVIKHHEGRVRILTRVLAVRVMA
jgi:hypothetical protein